MYSELVRSSERLWPTRVGGDNSEAMQRQQHEELAKIERRLKENRQRGHVSLPAAGPPVVTTTGRVEAGYHGSEVIGPQPARDAIRATIGGHEALRRWAEELRATATGSGLVPPVVWNSVHLVVTGVTATHALLTALHHPREYDEDDLAELNSSAAGEASELETAFENATGKTMPEPARGWLRQRSKRRPKPATARNNETTGPDAAPEGATILTRCAGEIQAKLDEGATLRIIMRGIPRTFGNIGIRERERTLEVPPGLTGTKWDALLAAIAEHIAWLGGYPRPAWVDEPQRFNDPPKSYTKVRKSDAVCYSPGAFIRHGTFADPKDLDARGGERHAWVP